MKEIIIPRNGLTIFCVMCLLGSLLENFRVISSNC